MRATVRKRAGLVTSILAASALIAGAPGTSASQARTADNARIFCSIEHGPTWTAGGHSGNTWYVAGLTTRSECKNSDEREDNRGEPRAASEQSELAFALLYFAERTSRKEEARSLVAAVMTEDCSEPEAARRLPGEAILAVGSRVRERSRGRHGRRARHTAGRGDDVPGVIEQYAEG